MTTSTLTLTDFLLQRIAEDEADVEKYVMEPGGIWHPSRILDECEAKRRIVEEHRLADDAIDADGWERPGKDCTGCWCEHPCPTLRFLAAVYADHPDYREEWRP